MTHVVCESKLRLVVRSSMHPCPGNWVAIGPRPPTHLVKELNVGTVCPDKITHPFVITVCFCWLNCIEYFLVYVFAHT